MSATYQYPMEIELFKSHAALKQFAGLSSVGDKIIRTEAVWIRSHFAAGLNESDLAAEIATKIKVFESSFNNEVAVEIVCGLLVAFKDADKVASRVWFGMAYVAELTKLLRKEALAQQKPGSFWEPKLAWSATSDLAANSLRGAIGDMMERMKYLRSKVGSNALFKVGVGMAITELKDWGETVYHRAINEVMP